MLDPHGFTLDEYAAHHGLPLPASRTDRITLGKHLAKRGYTCRPSKRGRKSVRLWSLPRTPYAADKLAALEREPT